MTAANDLRRKVAALATLAERDLAGVWRQVTTADLARDALMEVLPGLVATYGSAAAALAADWYDDLREQAAARGRFRANPADTADTGADVLARWGVGALYQATPDWSAAATLVAGGLQRRIANASRETITGSAVADPAARGWQRVGSGGSCGFCAMLLGRGAVYTESSADFQSHDHCNCSAAPVFD